MATTTTRTGKLRREQQRGGGLRALLVQLLATLIAATAAAAASATAADMAASSSGAGATSDSARCIWTSISRPMQLVRPDATHSKLEIVEDTIEQLRSLTGPIAVISTVGPFHSAEFSDSLHQQDPASGFKVGPTTNPETMGIWISGFRSLSLRPGQKEMTVLFVDTEGFAGVDANPVYDSKIFAVATLMSSHLLFNNVKIIDQSAIDYVELLARRTQLFALKAQLDPAGAPEASTAAAQQHQHEQEEDVIEFDPELVKFPPLTWVVEDFAQQLVNNETPTEWLHRLVNASKSRKQLQPASATHAAGAGADAAAANKDRKAESSAEASLADVFPSLACHTLFLPAATRERLIDLSMVSENDLTEDYRQDRDALWADLRTKVIPKTHKGKQIGGIQLGALARVLVFAANHGSMVRIPSIWHMFLDQQRKIARSECTAFYRREMSTYLRRLDPETVRQIEASTSSAVDASSNPSTTAMTIKTGLQSLTRSLRESNLGAVSLAQKAQNQLDPLPFAVPTSYLKHLHSDVSVHSMELHHQLVGSSDAAQEMRSSLANELRNQEDQNNQRMDRSCKIGTDVLSQLAEEMFHAQELPVQPQALNELATHVRNTCFKIYDLQLGYLKDEETFTKYRESLAHTLSSIIEARHLRNTEEHRKTLTNAIKIAMEQVHKTQAEAKSRVCVQSATGNTGACASADQRPFTLGELHALEQECIKVAEQEFGPRSLDADQSLREEFYNILLQQIKVAARAFDEANSSKLELKYHAARMTTEGNLSSKLQTISLPAAEEEVEHMVKLHADAVLKNYEAELSLYRDRSDYAVQLKAVQARIVDMKQALLRKNVDQFAKLILGPMEVVRSAFESHSFWFASTFRNAVHKQAEAQLKLNPTSAAWKQELRTKVIDSYIDHHMHSTLGSIRLHQYLVGIVLVLGLVAAYLFSRR
ncbi:hypothetical protein CAOG_003419 [Capsaspora owczarzaki ATCC 30864]|uniref:Guanylate-binding protein N-terminal domain-containing protein n=1 Tax=Capsaspora owczarzaki (strain ATCC 30864) TaxID=595528 RepID=A0A0D2VPL3_CAPO3|nr:hypothetical protein CAOG_003419 [Capsaspora owczarzaki ATCC 30864]